MTEPKHKSTYEGYEIEVWQNVTNIFNASNRSRIAHFCVELSPEQSERFIEGYLIGLEAGKQIGQMEEGERIRKVLGI